MAAEIGNQYAVGNEGGRPTKYRPAYAKQAYKLCLLGYTDKELADFFEVAESTINEWKGAYKVFSESIKKGKAAADSEVVAKLYHRAIGYKYDEVTFEKVDSKLNLEVTSNGEIKTDEAFKKRVVTKEIAADTTAQIFWLKNRQPDKWRDKTDIKHEGIPENLPAQVHVYQGNAPKLSGSEDEIE